MCNLVELQSFIISELESQEHFVAQRNENIVNKLIAKFSLVLIKMLNIWAFALIILNLMSNIRPSEIETCKIKQQIIDVDESK